MSAWAIPVLITAGNTLPNLTDVTIAHLFHFSQHKIAQSCFAQMKVPSPRKGSRLQISVS